MKINTQHQVITCLMCTTFALPPPAGFGQDGRLVDPLRVDPSRKGSVVNVNPVNTRPPSDTPEIRKYKKRFNSEILCAALWGKCVSLLVGWPVCETLLFYQGC